MPMSALPAHVVLIEIRSVAPARGRGLKLLSALQTLRPLAGSTVAVKFGVASFAGHWILAECYDTIPYAHS
jgi:hypothetical protein